MEKEVYDNMKQCANATGTPYLILKAAKNHPERPPGFNYSSGSSRIDWALLKPWLDAHMEELQAAIKDGSLDSLRKERMALDNHIKRLEIKKREGRSIDPEDWFQWFSDFGVELSTKARTIRKNLMEACPEYSAVIDSEFAAFFNTIQNKEAECRQK